MAITCLTLDRLLGHHTDGWVQVTGETRYWPLLTLCLWDDVPVGHMTKVKQVSGGQMGIAAMSETSAVSIAMLVSPCPPTGRWGGCVGGEAL